MSRPWSEGRSSLVCGSFFDCEGRGELTNSAWRVGREKIESTLLLRKILAHAGRGSFSIHNLLAQTKSANGINISEANLCDEVSMYMESLCVFY